MTLAVDEPGVIDAVGIDLVTGEVVLTIADHLAWDQDNEHLRILETKINRYLGFIEAGELVEAYPSAVGKPVRIDIVCKHPLREEDEQLLSKASADVERIGLTLTWRWRPAR
jgi:hypothetical protein